MYSQLTDKLAAIGRRRLPPEVGNGLAYDFVSDPLQHLPLLGRMPAPCSAQIAASPLGIGFETLDRDTFDPSETYPWLAESGIKHARCQTGWFKCEREVGKYDFRWLDEVVDGLTAIGVRPWFSLSFGHPAYTPCARYDELWRAANGRPPVHGFARGYVAQVPLYYGENAMRGWCAYVTALARHFQGRVDEFEVWNEPEGFWQHDGKCVTETIGIAQAARDYAKLVRVSARAVRAVIPDAKIIANVAHTGTTYITELGREKIGEVIDVMCYHFYGFAPEFMLRERVEHLRRNLAVPGRELRIWQGEAGCWVTRQCPPTEYIQAKYLVRRYTADLLAGAEMSSFFTITDFLNYYPDGSDQHYGVINAREKRPKLAYHGMQSMGWLCDGLTPAPDLLALFTPRNRYNWCGMLPYTVSSGAFRRRGVPVFALWTPESVEINAPIVSGVVQTVTAEDSPFTHPIVIDPIRANVYAVPTHHKVGLDFSTMTDVGLSEYLGAECYPEVPVIDYPLFLTDAALFFRD